MKITWDFKGLQERGFFFFPVLYFFFSCLLISSFLGIRQVQEFVGVFFPEKGFVESLYFDMPSSKGAAIFLGALISKNSLSLVPHTTKGICVLTWQKF